MTTAALSIGFPALLMSDDVDPRPHNGFGIVEIVYVGGDPQSILGVLAVGKLANLSVLDGDPTADIGNSKRIHAVWHRGKQAAGPVEMFTP